MNPYERIESSYANMCDIARSAGKKPPTTVVMNQEFFIEWYYYCEEHDLDYHMWKDRQVLVDKEGIFPLAWSYHLNTQKLS
jgi:hypothetical protein